VGLARRKSPSRYTALLELSSKVVGEYLRNCFSLHPGNTMKRKNLGQAINTAANLGVIAGIVFLAFEIQQNSELMRVQINQARADAAMVSNAQTFESAFIPEILVKIDQQEMLNAEEWIRYLSYFRSMNRNQDNVLSQHGAGMLGDNTPRSVADFACLVIGTAEQPAKAWDITKSGYSDAYIDFVEEALENCDDS